MAGTTGMLSRPISVYGEKNTKLMQSRKQVHLDYNIIKPGYNKGKGRNDIVQAAYQPSPGIQE